MKRHGSSKTNIKNNYDWICIENEYGKKEREGKVFI